MSRSELARRVGVTRQAVSLWFQHQDANLQSRHLLRLSKVLGVSVEMLVRPLPCFQPDVLARLRAALLWDRLYPDLDDFAIALTHVFSHGLSGCMLVGGTALAGYYAAHRRSDDLDLFTEDDLSQKAAVLAVKSLRDIGATGATLGDQRTTAHFYHATCHLDGHDFTAQVVLDANLFEIGSGAIADDGVFVADLKTLLKMKAATLVSRASEKDLYDLLWLFDQESELDLATLMALGMEVDGGRNAEGLLTNLVGTRLRE